MAHGLGMFQMFQEPFGGLAGIWDGTLPWGGRILLVKHKKMDPSFHPGLRNFRPSVFPSFHPSFLTGETSPTSSARCWACPGFFFQLPCNWWRQRGMVRPMAQTTKPNYQGVSFFCEHSVWVFTSCELPQSPHSLIPPLFSCVIIHPDLMLCLAFALLLCSALYNCLVYLAWYSPACLCSFSGLPCF